MAEQEAPPMNTYSVTVTVSKLKVVTDGDDETNTYWKFFIKYDFNVAIVHGTDEESSYVMYKDSTDENEYKTGAVEYYYEHSSTTKDIVNVDKMEYTGDSEIGEWHPKMSIYSTSFRHDTIPGFFTLHDDVTLVYDEDNLPTKGEIDEFREDYGKTLLHDGVDTPEHDHANTPNKMFNLHKVASIKAIVYDADPESDADGEMIDLTAPFTHYSGMVTIIPHKVTYMHTSTIKSSVCNVVDDAKGKYAKYFVSFDTVTVTKNGGDVIDTTEKRSVYYMDSKEHVSLPRGVFVDKVSHKGTSVIPAKEFDFEYKHQGIFGVSHSNGKLTFTGVDDWTEVGHYDDYRTVFNSKYYWNDVMVDDVSLTNTTFDFDVVNGNVVAITRCHDMHGGTFRVVYPRLRRYKLRREYFIDSLRYTTVLLTFVAAVSIVF